MLGLAGKEDASKLFKSFLTAASVTALAGLFTDSHIAVISGVVFCLFEVLTWSMTAQIILSAAQTSHASKVIAGLFIALKIPILVIVIILAGKLGGEFLISSLLGFTACFLLGIFLFALLYSRT